jgi:hypothetical protein
MGLCNPVSGRIGLLKLKRQITAYFLDAGSLRPPFVTDSQSGVIEPDRRMLWGYHVNAEPAPAWRCPWLGVTRRLMNLTPFWIVLYFIFLPSFCVLLVCGIAGFTWKETKEVFIEVHKVLLRLNNK